MTESPTESALNNNNNNNNEGDEEIPIEIVSEEEMALIEAAMASARAMCLPSSSSRRFHANALSVQSITALSKRGFSSRGEMPDLEDLGGFRVYNTTDKKKKKKARLPDSPLTRHRKNKPMSVTDFTSSAWCEKQKEFSLSLPRPPSKIMQAGSDRHTELEEQVVKKVAVRAESAEDRWALKLLNFMVGTNQMLFEGLTRELPVVCLVEDEWVVGVIDEIRMPGEGTDRKPLLVDVKTRNKPTLPSESQRRNGRLQLMIYKHMWDSLVSLNFPAKKFFERFSLNPYDALSKDIFETSSNLGLPAKTLEDMMRLYTNTCSMLPLAQDQMVLRYEFQKDFSLLEEDQFAHDPDWLKTEIQASLEFWRGEREAKYTPADERWKCRFCGYASICPAVNAKLESEGASSSTNSTPDDQDRPEDKTSQAQA